MLYIDNDRLSEVYSESTCTQSPNTDSESVSDAEKTVEWMKYRKLPNTVFGVDEPLGGIKSVFGRSASDFSASSKNVL